MPNKTRTPAMPDPAAVAAQDIAETRCREAWLKTGALQSAILNSANFSSIATDEKGVIRIFNTGAERMLGYKAPDVLDKVSPADICDRQELAARAKALSFESGTMVAPGFEALVYKAARGIEDIYKLTFIRKDGARFPAVVSVAALHDAQGALIGYLLIGIDTLHEVLGNERLEKAMLGNSIALKSAISMLESNIVLKRAISAAEKASRAKSEFLSRMSHELRTPLNAILGFAQLLEAGAPQLTEAQAERMHQITKAGWYLLELINEILDLAVIESGKLSLSPEPVALADVMRECRAMIEAQAQQHHVRLRFHPFDKTWVVYADRTRVKQVLINLLTNAIKYNREHGSVEVKCTASAPERIRIGIKDRGAGLSPEKLAHLFEPFNRLGQEGGAEEGTGMGLVVAKQLVEQMGGRIGVESAVGKGSEFWAELPRCVAQPAAGSLAPEEDAAPAPGNARQGVLLYVEDNPANMMLVEQIVKANTQVNMLSARTGQLGIELARAHLPDVILMDINLPDIGGVEALKILRKDPAMQHIPILALSANAMQSDIRKGLDAGFFRYLAKPIKVNDFLNALDDALEFSGMKPANANNKGRTK